MHPSLIIFVVEVDDCVVVEVVVDIVEVVVVVDVVEVVEVVDVVEVVEVVDVVEVVEVVDVVEVVEVDVERVAIDTLVLTVEIVYSCLIVVDELVPRLAVRVELPDMSRVVLCGALGGNEELPVLLQLLKEYP